MVRDSRIILECGALGAVPDGFLVYSGNDSDTHTIMSLGGHGVISVSAHLVGTETKRMVEFLSRLGLSESVLVVIAEADANVEKSARNLPTVKVLRSEGLNVYDLLHYRQVLFTQLALEHVSERLGA